VTLREGDAVLSTQAGGICSSSIPPERDLQQRRTGIYQFGGGLLGIAEGDFSGPRHLVVELIPGENKDIAFRSTRRCLPTTASTSSRTSAPT